MASTLQTLLIKLGFDVSSMPAGARTATSALNSIGAAAQQLNAAALPSAAALNNVVKAAESVKNTSGARATLTNLATGLREVGAATGNSAAALNAFARGARSVADSMKTGSAVNAYVRGAQEVMTATNGSTAALRSYVNAATTFAQAGGSKAGFMGIAQSISQVTNAAAASAAAMKAAGAAGAGATGGLGAAGAAASGAAGSLGMAGAASNVAGPSVMRLGIAANAAAGGLGRIPGPAMLASNAMRNVAASADMASNRASFMNRTLSMAFAFSGGVAVTTLFGFLANALLGFNSRLEQAHIAFTTLLGSSSAAEEFITKMEAFANVTPFNFQGVQDGAQRLMAMGFTAEQILPTLTAVGDAVAGLGGNTEKLDRITIALGQMSTAGRVNAQDMRQLTEAGIPAWKMLADGIGRSVAETRKLAENGLIPANEALSILLSGMETRFAGMMAKQARTAQGAFSTIRDVAIQTVSGAVQPAFEALSQVMVAIADFLINGGGKYVAPVIYAIGTAIAVALIPRMYGLAASAAAASITVGALILPIGAMIIAISVLATAWQENWGGMRDALTPILTPLFAIAAALMSVVANSGLLIPVLVALTSIITAKFVVGLIAAGITLAADTIGTLAFVVALGGLGTGAMGAAAGVGVLSMGMTGLATAITVALGPISILVAALGLATIALHNMEEERKKMQQDFGLTEKQAVAVQMTESGDPRAGAGAVKEAYESIPLAIREAMAKAKTESDKGVAGLNTEPIDFKKLFGDLKGDLANGTATMVSIFGTSMDSVIAAFYDNGDRLHKAGSVAMLELAKGIQEAQDAPVAALKNLKEMMANQLTPAAEIARDVGILMSSELALGLASGDAKVVAAAAALRQSTIEDLDRLTGGAFSAGTDAGQAWQAGLRASLTEAGDTWSELIRTGGLAEAGKDYIALGKMWQERFVPSANAATEAYNKLKVSIADGSSSLAQGAGDWIAQFGNSVEAVKDVGQTAGAEFMASIAQGIAQNADAPLNAFKDLLDMQKAQMSSGAQQALLFGILTSQQYRDGMASSNPQIVAQTIALHDFIMAQMNNLAPSMYAAGQGAMIALANGMISPAAYNALNKAALAQAMILAVASGDPEKIKAAFKAFHDGVNADAASFVPTLSAGKSAVADYMASLKTAGSSTSSVLGDAKDKMKSAFADIKAAAKSYFQQVHEDSLKALQDAHDLANAQLEAPANAFRAAITAERTIRREAELRAAVANAKNPADQMKAQQDLVDFLQDQQLMMLEEAAKKAQEINDKKLVAAKAAEDKRYADQVSTFNREIGELQRHMLRHPEEWKRMQAQVLALLASYGITYISAGASLGSDFADGLKESVGKVVEAAKSLAGAAADAFNKKFKADTGKPVPTPPPLPKSPKPEGGGITGLSGQSLTKPLSDQLVLPTDKADLMRALSGNGATPAWSTIASAPVLPREPAISNSIGTTTASASLSQPIATTKGGGTLVVVLDGKEIYRGWDEHLAVTEDQVTVHPNRPAR